MCATVKTKKWGGGLTSVLSYTHRSNYRCARLYAGSICKSRETTVWSHETKLVVICQVTASYVKDTYLAKLRNMISLGVIDFGIQTFAQTRTELNVRPRSTADIKNSGLLW